LKWFVNVFKVVLRFAEAVAMSEKLA
jgi:hypothetical protein